RRAGIGLHHGAIGDLRVTGTLGRNDAGVVDGGIAVVVRVDESADRQQVAAVSGDGGALGIADQRIAEVGSGHRAIGVLAAAGQRAAVVHGDVAVGGLGQHPEAVLAVGGDRAAVVDLDV